MCQHCVDLTRQYLPDISERDMSDLLMSCTCFPFGGPENLEPQLRAIATRRRAIGLDNPNWLAAEKSFVDQEMYAQYLAMKEITM